MKSSFKTTARTITAFTRNCSFLGILLAILFVVGCGRGNKIPVDEAKAREQVIPVRQGIAYQDSFLAARTQLARLLTDSTFLNRKFNLPNAETFNRDAIGLLLNAEGPGGAMAAGIRVYLGTDEKGLLRVVLVPVDQNGKDIIGPLLGNKTALNIPGISSAYAQGDGEVVENGQVCPPCQIGK